MNIYTRYSVLLLCLLVLGDRFGDCYAMEREETEEEAGQLSAQAQAQTMLQGRPFYVNRDKIDEKLANYLLNFKHSSGYPKAKFFHESLGFSLDKGNQNELADQIYSSFNPHTAKHVGNNGHGDKYEQVIIIQSSDRSRAIPVYSIWIHLDNKEELNLVTAYPCD